MNYDDLKKKLGIKVLPNQTPIVKVVEEEKLVEPAKLDTSSPIKIDQFKAQTQTSIKVEEEKVVEPSKSGAPASSPSIDPNAPASSLPLGWTEHTDPASGNTYYYNASIRVSQWEFPNAASVSAHKPKTSVKLLLGISFICVICVIFFINYISSPSDQELLYQEEYYRAVRVADSAAAVEAAIEAIGARVKDSSRDLKQAATQLENEKKLRIEAVKNFKRFDKKNLNVSKYRNGDAIPQVQDADAWQKLTTGAWCYYENKTANGTTYGKLYNWYAVNDPRGLAPKGYHIPTDEEWTILTDNLGDEAGTKMKSTTGWDDDGNGTNTSGFAGLPGGFRNYNGYFYDVGAFGYWWSSSEYSTYYAWYRLLDYDGGYVGSYYPNKQNGFSVRCLRD